MKKWPSLNKLVSVENAIRPLVKWWLNHMRFKPNNKYTGYELQEPLNRILKQPDFVLSKENLEQSKDSPITILLSIAFQLGTIQGVRMQQNKDKDLKSIILLLESAKEAVHKMQEKEKSNVN
jgi:hypothetical protein